MDFTPLASKILRGNSLRTDRWPECGEDLQTAQLGGLLSRAARTETGRRYGYAELAKLRDPRKEYALRVPMVGYEDIRADVMRMAAGERDVLWRGVCRNFAQSSGAGPSIFPSPTKTCVAATITERPTACRTIFATTLNRGFSPEKA